MQGRPAGPGQARTMRWPALAVPGRASRAPVPGPPLPASSARPRRRADRARPPHPASRARTSTATRPRQTTGRPLGGPSSRGPAQASLPARTTAQERDRRTSRASARDSPGLGLGQPDRGRTGRGRTDSGSPTDTGSPTDSGRAGSRLDRLSPASLARRRDQVPTAGQRSGRSRRRDRSAGPQARATRPAQAGRRTAAISMQPTRTAPAATRATRPVLASSGLASSGLASPDLPGRAPGSTARASSGPPSRARTRTRASSGRASSGRASLQARTRTAPCRGVPRTAGRHGTPGPGRQRGRSNRPAGPRARDSRVLAAGTPGPGRQPDRRRRNRTGRRSSRAAARECG